MFTTDNVKEVTVGTVTLTGTVHLDSLIITRVLDTTDGILTKVDGGLYDAPVDGADADLPVSLTLEKNGDLKWHSVPASTHGVVNVQETPTFMDVIGASVTTGLFTRYASRHIDRLSSMNKEESERYLLELFYNEISASERIKEITERDVANAKA